MCLFFYNLDLTKEHSNFTRFAKLWKLKSFKVLHEAVIWGSLWSYWPNEVKAMIESHLFMLDQIRKGKWYRTTSASKTVNKKAILRVRNYAVNVFIAFLEMLSDVIIGFVYSSNYLVDEIFLETRLNFTCNCQNMSDSKLLKCFLVIGCTNTADIKIIQDLSRLRVLLCSFHCTQSLHDLENFAGI